MLIYSGGGDFSLRVMELNHLTNGLVPLLESIVPLNAKILQNFSSQPLFINADFTRIQQVILNLVTNAAEALAEEDGTIGLETGVRFFPAHELQQCVAADPPAAGRFVFLNISDTGRGIDQQTLSRIFDPFFSTKFAGQGLGLSVIHGVIKGHQGAIWIETTLHEGSTVTVVFPEAGPPESQDSSLEPSEKKNANWKPKGCVLLADDEPNVRRVAARMLKKMGFEVIQASDGMEAVEIFSDNRDIISMVVLDLTMPRLGGQETLLRIRELSPEIPALLSSGYGQTSFSISKAGFIQKPYTLARFKDALQQVAELSSD